MDLSRVVEEKADKGAAETNNGRKKGTSETASMAQPAHRNRRAGRERGTRNNRFYNPERASFLRTTAASIQKADPRAQRRVVTMNKLLGDEPGYIPTQRIPYRGPEDPRCRSPDTLETPSSPNIGVQTAGYGQGDDTAPGGLDNGTSGKTREDYLKRATRTIQNAEPIQGFQRSSPAALSSPQVFASTSSASATATSNIERTTGGSVDAEGGDRKNI